MVKQRAGEGVTIGLVVVIDAIQRDIALIGACAGDGAKAAVLCAGGIAGTVVVAEVRRVEGLAQRELRSGEWMGVAWTSALDTALPSVASVKFTCSAAVTSTTSLTPPTFSLKLKVAGWLTSSVRLVCWAEAQFEGHRADRCRVQVAERDTCRTHRRCS